MPEAVRNATDNGTLPVSVRDLFYDVRPLMQQYCSRVLDYGYFSQTLVPAYQQEYGPISKLYYDPRGVLYEPHTHKEVAIGTREIEGYEFPFWVYDKILYIEKKGIWPLLKSAQIAERYDMAIVTAEGYAPVAARTLFEKADKNKKYKLFVPA